jgi:hypothetical protein
MGNKNSNSASISTFIAIIATFAGGLGYAQGAASAADQPCVDYFTLGGSRCRPQQPQAPAVPTLPVQPSATDPVQAFLDNHGKPPREFAEFYVNPTPENARRWAQAFQAQQAKAAALAAAWKQAESALKVAPAAPVSAPPQPLPAPTTPVPLGATPPSPPPLRLGGFATPVEQHPIMVYYFSASCPFCARLKPDLLAVTQSLRGKLVFACVDLTPLSPRQAPHPTNRNGLPCDWRLPQPGEVEKLQIRQTPTLLISRPGGNGARLTGVVEPSQLREALTGQPG